MAKVIVNGTSVMVPDDLSDEDKVLTATSAYEALNPNVGGASAPSTTTHDQSELYHDKDWVDSSRAMYKYAHGVDFDGDDKAAADYGLQQMSYFNYNTIGMAVNATAIVNAPDAQKKAFLTLMDKFDNLDYSVAGAGRAIGAAATDPTTYLGLGSLGIGTLAGSAGKAMGKAAIREALKKAAITGAVQGGLEGAVYGAAQSELKQSAIVGAGGQDEVSQGQVLKDALVSGAVGAGLGAGLGAAGAWFFRKKGVAPAQTDLPPSLRDVPEDTKGPAVGLNTKLETASRLEQKTPTTAQSADVVRHSQTTMDPAERVLSAIKESAPDGILKDFPESKASQAEKAYVPAELIMSMPRTQIKDWVDKLVTSGLEAPQMSVLKGAVKQSTDQLEVTAHVMYAAVRTLEDGPEKMAALRELEQVKRVRDNIKEADTYLSSVSGSDLGSRKGSINTGEFRGVSEESFLTKHGIDPATATPEDKAWAESQYFDLLEKHRNKVKQRDEVRVLQSQLDDKLDAYLKKDPNITFDQLLKLQNDLEAKVTETAAKETQDIKLFDRWGGKAHEYTNDLNTVAISSVFGPSTLYNNTLPSLVKVLTKPAMHWIAKGPLDEAAFREMTTFYGTMFNNIGISWQMAKASDDLGRSLMMADSFAQKFSEGSKGSGLLNNRVGRAITIIPRWLGRTDEFFRSLVYRGHAMGEAMYKGVEEASRLNKTGAEKEAIIQRFAKETQDRLFGPIHNRDKMISWLREAGEGKGLKGDKLDEWVKTQIDTRGHMMREATVESSVKFTKDFLFNREFSGESKIAGIIPISQVAKGYQSFTSQHPWFRLMGQLFFITPVRVFEEGIRLTPGVQLLAPNFMADLARQNGDAAYARAMSEAMVGYAMAQWAMVMYAKGDITGGGPTDYKQRRTISGEWKPYQIKFGDKQYDYRNLDPFATPIKIIVNAMERMHKNHMDSVQGKYAMSDHSEAMEMIKIGIAATAQAVKDANLMEGIRQFIDTSNHMTTDGNNDIFSYMEKMMGQKLAMAVPSVWTKGQAIAGNDTVPDPSSLWQYVEAKYNPGSSNVAHQHDAMGNMRHVQNPWGAMFGYKEQDVGPAQMGRSDKAIAVQKELDKLAIATNTNYEMPTKDSVMMPSVDDLRSKMTKDGSMTLYDKVNSYIRESDITDKLHHFLVGRDDLSWKARADAAHEVINTYRKEAFNRLWSEENGWKADFVKGKRLELEGMAGVRDSLALPYLKLDK